MRNLLDISNIENVLKFYRFTEGESRFIDRNVYNIPGFNNFPVDFSKNLNLWEENKAHIFKLFGNKLKIVKELGDQNVCTATMIDSLKEDFLIANGEYFNILVKLSGIFSLTSLIKFLSIPYIASAIAPTIQALVSVSPP